MKKVLTLCSLLFLAGTSFAQATLAENFVYSKTCLDADCIKKAETVQYFDGLGRAKQVVNVKASPQGKDVVTKIEYDQYSRQTKDYLPVPQSGTNNGAIYTNPLSNASVIYGSEKIYAEKILESSPLDRIQQQIQVGTDWTTHPVVFAYGTNDTGATTKVNKYVFNTNSVIPIISVFPASQLYKNTVTDEDGNISLEFKNGQGQTLLVRKNDGIQNIDTYYVYNEYDQLALVIPPLAAVKGTLLQIDLDQLCYQYKYDGKNRLIEKKLPGKGWEWMVYDAADRIVATKDAQNLWIFTKYDKFNRVVYTGLADLGSSRSSVQTALDNITINNETRGGTFNSSNMDVEYSNTAYPTTINKLLSVNYYDIYPDGSPTLPPPILGQILLTDDTQNSIISTKALPTASYIKNIEDDNWTRLYTWYDTKGRPIGSHSINHLGGFTKTESELDFAGVVIQSNTRHKRLIGDAETLIHEEFTYDSQNRMLLHKHQVNTQPMVTLTENTYNELSQLSQKKVGNNLQTVDYTYNIRGWMKGINDPANLGTDLFGYKIKYTNPVYTTLTTPKYNGNIAEVDWKTSDDNLLKRYSYQYDQLNRLLKGNYSEPFTTTPQNGFYNEELTYDVNGNIQTLKRNSNNPNTGSEMIDNLAYTYTGNQLNTVTDTSQNYGGYPDSSGSLITYDSNGNMTKQEDKGIINIGYNFLNLPTSILFNQTYIVRVFGMEVEKNVNTAYLYRADGIKLKKIYSFAARNNAKYIQTEYLDGFQYEATASSSVFPSPILQFVPTAEGYFNFKNNSYIYQYKDQVGNIRLSYFKDSTGNPAIDKTANFYPFGLEFYSSTGAQGNASYRYGYQEQERQLETGWDSFKWRNYDSSMGRFFNVDPLSEKYGYQSHYNFSENRVVDGIELEGLEWYASPMLRPMLMENSAWKPIVAETVTKTAETTAKTSESLSKTSEGAQKSNERVKYENEVERAQDKMEGINRAQENLKKNAPKGSKQNAINSTRKSQQNLTNALKRIDLSSIDEFDVKIMPKIIKVDNITVPKPRAETPNFSPKKPTVKKIEPKIEPKNEECKSCI